MRRQMKCTAYQYLHVPAPAPCSSDDRYLLPSSQRPKRHVFRPGTPTRPASVTLLRLKAPTAPGGEPMSRLGSAVCCIARRQMLSPLSAPIPSIPRDWHSLAVSRLELSYGLGDGSRRPSRSIVCRSSVAAGHHDGIGGGVVVSKPKPRAREAGINCTADRTKLKQVPASSPRLWL